MPRPRKWRKVCAMPRCTRFAPSGTAQSHTVEMTVDEYEAIRLIDWEGFTQEKCAAQMEVARTTAQSVYQSARRKLADCIVNGAKLTIEGGEYRICGLRNSCKGCCYGRGKCPEEAVEKMGYDMMKIAVTFEEGNIFQHFGHTEHFKIYVIKDKKIAESQIRSTNGSGHGELSKLLSDWGVSKLICGGIGAGAKVALNEAGIELFAGVSGEADEAVEAYLRGELSYNSNPVCEHHGHEHGSCQHGGGRC